ncbi:MAG: hypothetical protein Q8L29_02865 [archaeon]|nr:hypothetical protein [archaeon]
MQTLQNLVQEKHTKIDKQTAEKKEAVNYLANYTNANFQQLLNVFNEVTARRDAIPFMTHEERTAAREKAYLEKVKAKKWLAVFEDEESDPQDIRDHLSELSIPSNTPAEKLLEAVYDLTRKLILGLKEYEIGHHMLAGMTLEKQELARTHFFQRPEVKMGLVTLYGNGNNPAINTTPAGREVYENSRLALDL